MLIIARSHRLYLKKPKKPVEVYKLRFTMFRVFDMNEKNSDKGVKCFYPMPA